MQRILASLELRRFMIYSCKGSENNGFRNGYARA